MAQRNRPIVVAIATTERAGDGNAPVPGLADDQPVAPFQTGIAERQPPQPVIHMRVDPRLIEQQIRRET